MRKMLRFIGFRSRLFQFTLFFLAFCGPVLAEKRVALVVGNSAYSKLQSLKTPANDAKLMADTLKEFGFILVGGEAQLNLDKAGFEAALKDFGDKLRGADVSLFYYAGHAGQSAGKVYLTPVSVDRQTKADLALMVDFEAIQHRMEDAQTPINICVVNASRTEFTEAVDRRTAARGMPPTFIDRSIVAMATQPLRDVQEGDGVYSPYTAALTQAMRRKPDLELRRMLGEVRDEVVRLTNGKQRPEVWDSLIGEFTFATK